MVGEDAAVGFGRRTQRAAGGDEGVAADGDGDVVLGWGWGWGGGGGGGGGGFGGGLGGRRWDGADEVSADADFGLDHGATSEDDVGGAVDLGAAGDFVAGVLCGRVLAGDGSNC